MQWVIKAGHTFGWCKRQVDGICAAGNASRVPQRMRDLGCQCALALPRAADNGQLPLCAQCGQHLFQVLCASHQLCVLQMVAGAAAKMLRQVTGGNQDLQDCSGRF